MLILEQLAPGDVIQHADTGEAFLVIAIFDGERKETLPGSALDAETGSGKNCLVVSEYDIPSAIDCSIFTELALERLTPFVKLPIPRKLKYQHI